MPPIGWLNRGIVQFACWFVVVVLFLLPTQSWISILLLSIINNIYIELLIITVLLFLAVVINRPRGLLDPQRVLCVRDVTPGSGVVQEGVVLISYNILWIQLLWPLIVSWINIGIFASIIVSQNTVFFDRDGASLSLNGIFPPKSLQILLQWFFADSFQGLHVDRIV